MKHTIAFLVLTLFSTITFSQNYKFGKVSKDELLEKAHPLYPEAEAAILYREIKTYVEYNKEKGFVANTEVFERIKIYDPSGFDWGTVEAKLYNNSDGSRETFSGLKAYTYTYVNGKVVETKLSNSGIFEEERSKYMKVKKFTLPALKEGCVIEYKYKMKSPYLNNINTFMFQESIPVNEVKVRFKAPEYFNYKTHRRGWIAFDIEKERYERTVNNLYTSSRDTGIGGGINSSGNQKIKFFENISEVNLTNIAPIKEEAFAGNVRNYASALKFELEFTRFPSGMVETYATDWESVSNKIYASTSFGDQLNKKSYFEKDVDALINDAVDSKEKMMRIFEFVKGKMTWNKYVGIYTDEGVQKAYKEEVGNTADINLMLTAMFRYAGLKANPVLISTKTHGIPVFPTLQGFNYVIAAVETDDGLFLFDGANRVGYPNILDKELLNWQGRIIRKNDSSNWVSLNPDKLAVEAFMVDAKINSEGTVKGSIKNQFTGNKALENRRTFANLSVTDVEEKMGERFDQLNLSEANIQNLMDPYQPLKVDFNFESDDYVEKINDNLYVSPLLFLSMEENPFKQEDRKFPVDYGYPSKKRYIVSIELPEGYKVESMPQGANVKMGDNVLAFKYLISENNNKIQLMAEFIINKYLVGPEAYADIKQFYQYMIDKENEKIVLSKI